MDNISIPENRNQNLTFRLKYFYVTHFFAKGFSYNIYTLISLSEQTRKKEYGGIFFHSLQKMKTNESMYGGKFTHLIHEELMDGKKFQKSQASMLVILEGGGGHFGKSIALHTA